MYQNSTDQALLELLNKNATLTFESQLHLLKVLKDRNIDCDLSILEQRIADQKNKIKQLDYLKNIGLKKTDLSHECIKISRTGWAVFTDITAIFLGLILCFISIYGIFSLISSFQSDEDFSIFPLLVNAGLISLGVLGIQFLHAAKRLFDFSGFELLSINSELILRKRLDLRLVEAQTDTTGLTFKKQGGMVGIWLDEAEVISIPDGNLIHEMTLKQLVHNLKYPH